MYKKGPFFSLIYLDLKLFDCSSGLLYYSSFNVFLFYFVFNFSSSASNSNEDDDDDSLY